MYRLLASALLFSLAAGCSQSGDSPADMAPATPDFAPHNALVAARPYNSKVPDAYDGKTPTPLVILLHGFGANGVAQDAYFGLGTLVDRFGFLYAYPDGTPTPGTGADAGKLFWNATDVCCDFGHTGVDDVAYIDAIIDDMSAHYNVDPRRIYVVGHSNGGFMSHRYACDRAGRVAAIVSLAGASWKDPARCQPSEPVAILEVHGDMDTDVPYGGGGFGGAMLPSAPETVEGWAQKNGCGATVDGSAAPLDLEADLPGAETAISRYNACKPGGAAELWTIHGGTHIPTFNRPGWGEAVWGWFSGHPKPQHP